jgi:hypothetical protein
MFNCTPNAIHIFKNEKIQPLPDRSFTHRSLSCGLQKTLVQQKCVNPQKLQQHLFSLNHHSINFMIW